MQGFHIYFLRRWLVLCTGMVLANTEMVAQSTLQATHLRTEYKVNDFTDSDRPRFSWELQSKVRHEAQRARQILVASSQALLNANTGDMWNSGKVKSTETVQLEYQGKKLASNKTYFWKVRSWDKNEKPGAWSQSAQWHTGLLHQQDWKAHWIGYDVNHLANNKTYHLPPAAYFRTGISLAPKVKKAVLYVSALGIFEFYINGQRIGNDYFTPGWTDYNRRVYYNAYDVTDKIRSGENVFGAILSTGWYAGYLGYALLVGSSVTHSFYGKQPLLKAQIEIENQDGSQQTVITNQEWKAATGAVLEADILNGETVNANLEPRGWNLPGFKADAWEAVQLFPEKKDIPLQLYPGNPVRVIEQIAPVAINQQPDGKYLINMGQNFSGVVKLNIKGLQGDTIVIRYGEMLFPDGRLMTENLRRARAVDTYILSGDKEGETWMPRFTYHGFQYVEISGLRQKPTPKDIQGMVMSSATPVSGSFNSSSAMLNQLYKNIIWTQRSNYFDIPTDCPQRDERLGWTGDAQVYMRSAMYNNDVAAFHTKWITDLNDAQLKNGAFPIYAPMPMGSDGKSAIRASDTYSPGWSEAGIICPYSLFKMYGDTRIIKKSWPHMQNFMDFLKSKTKGQYYFTEGAFDEVSPKGGFGDWLSIGKKTSPDMLATIYYFYCARMMNEMAAGINQPEAALEYAAVAEKIKKAFARHYIGEKGKFKIDTLAYGNGDGYVDGDQGFSGHTQTAYNNAIYMDILSPENKMEAGKYLRALVIENKNQLATGFLGFKPLLPALSRTGSHDLAFTLLADTTYPSLGFEVVNGATTIWERWDSYIKGKGFEHNAGMNSFNHYAFGAVGEWMFEHMGGIQPLGIGFKTFQIKPEISFSHLSFAALTYQSVRGKIASSWKQTPNGLVQSVTIPVNTQAEVYIPANMQEIFLEGRPIKDHKDLFIKTSASQFTWLSLGSGNYQFVVKKKTR